MAPFPSLTTTWHSKPYPAISPKRPELSAKGRVVVITGGGGAIGTATALAFAAAGAQKIALIGRREGPLTAAKRTVEGQVRDVQVLVVQGDLANSASMIKALDTVAQQFGRVSVLVANAAYLSTFEAVSEADPEEWWRGFEINTKGAFNVARAFLPVATSDAVVVDISTGPVHLPAMARASAYVASKLAGTKVWEAVAAENANISVVHLHPGVVASELNIKSGVTATDEASLPGQFVVWAVSPEAEFLRGKYLWCNWDVEELKRRKEELIKPDQLVITLNGWPFGQSGETDALKF